VSLSNHENAHPDAIISNLLDLFHNINSIKNPSPSPLKCKPWLGPWSILHLVCNMLSMMFGINVLHEISRIYPNIIIHLWNIHILKMNRSSHQTWLSICHIQLHEAASIISIVCHPLSLPQKQVYTYLIIHVSKVVKSRLNPCPSVATKASSSL